jgi:tripartite ATP-independent transporter DctM subunit
MVIRHPAWAPQAPKASVKERIHSTLQGGLLQILIVFVIAMGGLFAGFFTPTEAGAVGAFGILVVTLVARQLDRKKLFDSLMAGVRLMAMVFILLACANVFSRMIVISKIPAVIGNFVDTLSVPPMVILLVIIVIFILLGMVTDLLSMMLITLPIFHPIVVDTLGYDSVWFGVFMIVLIGIGGITPPVGNGVFMVMGATRWDKENNLSLLFKGIWPFVIASLALVFIMMVLPQMVMWLPTTFYGGA